ncbi:uncharacterized protein VP01_2875g4 [Puccinia sorghi]|uniref:Reverse transcriptase Ty1/copia-type domain-containing protein n=1 Tax=Puccinia sorghi TaxID=27349 RepID=A0A0L6V1T7_9BASI|nr:uncharacterized protein VP01_2875g4 [Puccinia sorghi]
MSFFWDALESKLRTAWDDVAVCFDRCKDPFLTQKVLDSFTSTKTLCQSVPLQDTNSLTSPQPDEETINPNGYLSIVGSLNYLAVATHPDLSFAVGFLSQFAKSPTTRHWSAIQHVLGYIKAFGCRLLVIEPSVNREMKTWVRQ